MQPRASASPAWPTRRRRTESIRPKPPSAATRRGPGSTAPGDASAHEHKAETTSRRAAPALPGKISAGAIEEDSFRGLCTPLRAAPKAARQMAEASCRKALTRTAPGLSRKKLRETASGPKGLGIFAAGARIGTTTRLATKKRAWSTLSVTGMRLADWFTTGAFRSIARKIFSFESGYPGGQTKSSWQGNGTGAANHL